MKQRLFLLLFFVSTVFSIQAKTDKFGTWIEFEFSKKITKKIDFSIVPEIRLQDNFNLDEYMVDGKLAYEAFKFLDFSAAYRINTTVKKRGNETVKRIALDASGKKEFGRFTGSIRLRFTNYSEDENGVAKASYFRPRIKLVYNIKGNKITPFANYELFRNLKEKEWQKSRFDIGFTRKLGDFHRVGIYYRLQDYLVTERNSINILGIDYRLKF